MATTLERDDARVLILATDGFEQAELFEPYEKLTEAGAEVDIVSLEKGEIKGWDEDDWGKSIEVDKTIDEVSAEDYDAIVLPGGQINPDLLRVEDAAIELIRDFADQEKIVAAICHAPWLLIEADLVSGRQMTSYKSIRTDMENAGADVQDESVVVDGRFITSRNPDDLPDFIDAIIDGLNEGAADKGDAAEAA